MTLGSGWGPAKNTGDVGVGPILKIHGRRRQCSDNSCRSASNYFESLLNRAIPSESFRMFLPFSKAISSLSVVRSS